MGGLGSGRPSGSGRAKVEGCRSLDVNRLHREGCLPSDWSGIWQWTRDGERVAWINLRTEFDRLHLTYRVRIGGGDWEDIGESVRIVRVACQYGGVRPYFICPGIVNGRACGRRVPKAIWTRSLFRVPPLQSAGLCESERGQPGSRVALRQRDQATPRRRPWHGLAVSGEAQRYVATDLRAPSQTDIRD